MKGGTMPDTLSPSTPAAQAAADKLAGMRQPMRTLDSSLLESVAPPAADNKKKSKKSKKPAATGPKRFIKPVVGLLVLAFVAHMAEGKFVKPHYSKSHPAPNGAIIPLVNSAGTGTITTNLSDGHLVQLQVSLQMSSVGSSKTEAKQEDALLGATINILGKDNYNELLAPGGRAQLESQLLGTYQRILGTSEGAEAVTGVYFTSFVLQ
jgi:flagellar basal body-associated protein FliL